MMTCEEGSSSNDNNPKTVCTASHEQIENEDCFIEKECPGREIFLQLAIYVTPLPLFIGLKSYFE